MTPGEIQTMLDAKRAWLIPYLQGWGWKLDECCSGIHVHRKAQIRQVITSWLEVLQRPDCTLNHVKRIEEHVPAIIGRARNIYREYISVRDAEREMKARKASSA